MSSYRSHTTGELHTLTKGSQLGSGAYGSVGNVVGRPDFVYKDIALTPTDKDWVALTRETRIKAVYRELWALKKLGYLEGYIRENDTITIIMRKIEGKPERRGIPNPRFNRLLLDEGPEIFDLTSMSPTPPEYSVASHIALLDLNRQGVYHQDAHPANCIMNRDSQGKVHATFIDFGNAAPYSLFSQMVQTKTYNNRAREPQQEALPLIEKAVAEYHKQFQLKRYFTYGLLAVGGLAVVSGFGPTSYLAYQLCRSYFSHRVLRELRAVLDACDDAYCNLLEANIVSAGQLKIFKALINTGYALLSLYSLVNAYSAFSNLNVNPILSELHNHLSTLDFSSLPTAAKSLVSDCLIPTLSHLMSIFRDPSAYSSHVVNVKMLDITLAQATRLVAHLQDSVTGLASALERGLPADCLLVAADAWYAYNPRLLFTNIQHQAKKCLWKDEASEGPQPRPRPV